MKLKITKKDKFLNQTALIGLLNEFIADSYSGRRTKKNGTRITNGTIRNYEYLQKSISEFDTQSSFELKLYIVNNLTQSQKETAKRYYQKFYSSFTNFLYKKKGYYDNYVGLIIKCLRSFFNYLEQERNISVGTYHRSFYVPVEEIPIIALNQEQLHYIIYNEEFDQFIKEHQLEKIKDIFVFGCTVALRVSDLLSLSKKNLIVKNGNHYIRVKSQKTATSTQIKLPIYCVDILNRYKSRSTRLLPEISKAWFNTKLKEMALLIPDNFDMPKIREQKGKQVIVYKDPKKRIHYKLSDHISTHTMRRTAITTMLCLGMPEHLVRKISGHAANSKEFFRYVLLSQSFIDQETDLMFEKLAKV
ncbi:MAG: tyrosine-type recombinase/integrase [Crocinitomicaceae bacterium]